MPEWLMARSGCAGDMEMKLWLSGICLLFALVIIPAYVEWLRHRPHRLTQPTQQIVLVGLAVQSVLIGLSIAILVFVKA